MKRITVFCGSSGGNDNIFQNEARSLGKILAEKNIGLVYGGAQIGVMGAVANGALEAGGEVIGVIPGFLKSKEIAHPGLSQMITVDTMHERKTRMNELCQGVIALPGGFGTLEELFEMLTWGQLGLHSKPIGLLNTNSYFNHLLQFIQEMVDQGFLKEIDQERIIVSADIEQLIEKMKDYRAPEVPKWLDADET